MKNNIINMLLILFTIEACSFIALVLLDQNSNEHEQIYYGENKNIFIRGDCKGYERLKV